MSPRETVMTEVYLGGREVVVMPGKERGDIAGKPNDARPDTLWPVLKADAGWTEITTGVVYPVEDLAWTDPCPSAEFGYLLRWLDDKPE